LADATTNGFTLFGVITVGACPNTLFWAAAATATAAPVCTNYRRLILLMTHSRKAAGGSPIQAPTRRDSG